jgi:hypothetical protein
MANVTRIVEVTMKKAYEISKNGWDGTDEYTSHKTRNPWNYVSSLLFSITISTTIGKGFFSSVLVSNHIDQEIF